jgi:hypothetical protein
MNGRVITRLGSGARRNELQRVIRSSCIGTSGRDHRASVDTRPFTVPGDPADVGSLTPGEHSSGDPSSGGTVMPGKTPQRPAGKKVGKSLKEKREAKKEKQAKRPHVT